MRRSDLWLLFVPLFALAIAIHPAAAILSPLYYTSATGNVVIDMTDAPGGQVEFFMWQLGTPNTPLEPGFRIENLKRLTNSAVASVLPNFILDVKFNSHDPALATGLELIPAGAYDLGDILPVGLSQSEALAYIGAFPYDEENPDDVLSLYGTPDLELHGFGLVHDGVWLGAGDLNVAPSPPSILPAGDPPLDLDFATSVELMYDPSNGHVSFDSSGPEGGYVIGYGLRSQNGSLRYPLFEPITEGLRNSNNYAVEELTSDGIAPGVYDLGALLAPGLSNQAVAEAIGDSYFISNEDFFSPDFTIRNVTTPFQSLTTTGTSVDLQFFVEAAIPSFHNGSVEADVNNDGRVSPIDALFVINDLDYNGGRELPLLVYGDAWPSLLLDVNEDGFVSPVDALMVINLLDEGIDVTRDPIRPKGGFGIRAVPEPVGSVWLLFGLLTVRPVLRRQ